MPFPLELWLVHPEPRVAAAFTRRFAGLPQARAIVGRFEELEPHDCFVTAANSFGIMNAGSDAAITRRFGAALQEKIQLRILDEFLGEQPVGSCMIVATGDASLPFIGHAPTMRVPGSIQGSDAVYRAMWGALLAIYRHNLAAETKIASVAFPAMGAGFGAVPHDEAARQMAIAYKHYLSPPHRLDWDSVADRQRAIVWDEGRRVVDRY